MPFDPFFTSAHKDEERERKLARISAAKAYQFRLHTAFLSNKSKKVAVQHAAAHHFEIVAGQTRKRGFNPIAGGKSLVGFKQPKKVWDERVNKNKVK